MTTTIVIAIILVFGFVFIQNRLAKAQNGVQSGYSGIQVQLKRRHDLVPALVESVRSAITQENKIFQGIMDVREKAVQAIKSGGMKDVENAEEELSTSLRQFFGYTESHPEVTSTGNVRTLQKQLEETEDQISAARRLYNGNVEYYNTMLDAIPSNWIAQMMRMKRAEFFNLDETALAQVQSMPKIDLPGANRE